MQSARVYRSYLRKRRQHPKSTTTKDSAVILQEKSRDTLADHTRNIARNFCTWVQSIEGDDPKCNPTEDEVLIWFDVGLDALDLEEKELSPETDEDVNGNASKLVPITTRTVQRKPDRNSRRKLAQRQTDADVLEWTIDTDDMIKMQQKKHNLDSKLQNLPVSGLLREQRNRSGRSVHVPECNYEKQ